MARPKRLVVGVGLVLVVGALAVAQRPFARRHTATESAPLRLVPADRDPPADNRVTLDEREEHRHVASNGVPEHLVGRFPNRGNPNSIREQRHRFRVPLEPRVAPQITRVGERGYRVFGVAVNGVTFDPGTAEVWQGDRRSGWNYDALSGAIPLGLDENHAHVQPTGKYHYHGLPTGLLESLGVEAGEHSPLVGWAADGFPIYALYGYAEAGDAASGVRELTTGYRLKAGDRPGGREPDGRHDGTFVQDYEFRAGAGDLDECNGRECVTPEFPDGTYAYFLTTDWPVVPRAFRGEPVRMR